MKRLSESVFDDIITRSKGNDVRKEDEFHSNIKNMKPVDLGSNFPLFADIDLEVNGETHFDWYEFQDILPKIEKTGWRVIGGPNEVQKLFYLGDQPPKFNSEDLTKKWVPKEYGSVTGKETGETLFFYTKDPDNNYYEYYWCDNDYPTGLKDSPNGRGFEVGDPESYYGCLISTNNFSKKKKCKIRLVKDK